MRHIREDDVVNILQSLVRVPSVNPPGDEREVASEMAKLMKKAGMETSVEEFLPNRVNAYGTIQGKERNAPTLLLNGHIDVVPPGDGWSKAPFGCEIEGGKLYGRGSCDMKGGVAAMVAAAKALVESGVELRGSLIVMGAADEEENMHGTRHFLKRGGKADFGIVGEPTELKLCVASKGDVYYEITCFGRAAHASVPEQGINAVYKMQKVIEQVRLLHNQLRSKKHQLLGSPTLTVGTIVGGTITCAVPAFCKVTIDRRTLPVENSETGRKELQALLDKLAAEDPEFKAELRITVDAPPMEVAETEPIATATRNAVESVLGTDGGIHGFSAVSDASNFVKAGIPTVVLGPGSLSMAHKPDECVPIDEVVKAAQIYAATAINLLG